MKQLAAGLCLCLLIPANLLAADSDDSGPAQQPSLQLLEFLADFGEVDPKTWDLIEFHAKQDSPSNNQGDNQSGSQETTDETD